MEADGCLVSDSKITSGRRYESSDKSKKQWGGKRTKNDPSNYSPGYDHVHTDLWDVVRERNSASFHRARNENNETVENENIQQSENNMQPQNNDFEVPENTEVAEI